MQNCIDLKTNNVLHYYTHYLCECFRIVDYIRSQIIFCSLRQSPQTVVEVKQSKYWTA